MTISNPSDDLTGRGAGETCKFPSVPSLTFQKPGLIQDWRGVLRWTAIIALSCFMWLAIISALFGLGDVPS